MSLEAYFECEGWCPFCDERAMDAEDEFLSKIQTQASVDLESVSLVCVKRGFQLSLPRRQVFPASDKLSAECAPARLFPGSIISLGRRGEQANRRSDRKCDSDASNLERMHGQLRLGRLRDTQLKCASAVPIWRARGVRRRVRALDGFSRRVLASELRETMIDNPGCLSLVLSCAMVKGLAARFAHPLRAGDYQCRVL